MVSNSYTLECSGPYWSNPPFLIFDIRALWHSGLIARVPNVKKLKRVLDQYKNEQLEKSVGLKGLM